MFHKDEYIKDTSYYRMEVPGGWLYRYSGGDQSPVFVPFSQNYTPLPAPSIKDVVIPLKKDRSWADAYLKDNVMELN